MPFMKAAPMVAPTISLKPRAWVTMSTMTPGTSWMRRAMTMMATTM